MDDSSKNLDYGSIEELAKAAEAGDPEALAKMQDLAQAMRPLVDMVAKNLQPLKEVQDSIRATLSRVTENLQPLQQMQESLRKFAAEMAAWNMEHSAALEVLQDEAKTQAFLEKLTVDDLRAALDEPTVRKVAPLLRADLSGGQWLEILDSMELGEAVALYEYVASKPTEYRTRSKAGEVVDVPEQLALISSKPYKFALSYYNQYQGQNAYLFLLKDAKDLNIEKDGTFTIKGLPVTTEEMQRRAESEISAAVDPGFLSIPLSIIYKRFKETGEVLDVYSVYVPELISKLHPANPSKDSINAIISSFSQYDSLVGMLRVKKNGKYYKKYYKVMTFLGYDEEKKRIEFSSPFITKTLREAYESSIRLDKKTNKPRKQLPNGLYDTKAYISDVASLNLRGERNSRAVRIVEIIVTLVEEAGNNIPRIKAATILSYMPDFQKDLEKTAATGDKNKKLQRAFKKAFEILREPGKAGLIENYPGIELPDPTDVPTMRTLATKIYTFANEGKVKK